MRPDNEFFVYIVANEAGVLHTGMATNLVRRVWQHKAGLVKGFSAKHITDRLVFYETYRFAADAMAREKELKGWDEPRRADLVTASNPEWKDLAEGWFKDIDPENPPEQW